MAEPIVRSPIARSPIAQRTPRIVRDGWEICDPRSTTPGSASAPVLADCSPMPKWLVRGSGVLTVPFGRARREGEMLVVGSGPGEWTVLGGRTPPAPAADFVSVIDVTHGRALVRLTGVDSPNLLAKVCAIDLSDRVTPDGAAFRSSVAKLVTDVVRDDRDGTRSYLLHCERSSGQYLFDALLDAGAEFGIGTTATELR